VLNRLLRDAIDTEEFLAVVVNSGCSECLRLALRSCSSHCFRSSCSAMQASQGDELQTLRVLAGRIFELMRDTPSLNAMGRSQLANEESKRVARGEDQQGLISPNQVATWENAKRPPVWKRQNRGTEKT
jgi:hypothetical protein